MIGRRALLLATLLSGCASRPAASPAPRETSDEALASAAAALLCPALAGRSFSAATTHGDAQDAHATLLACDAAAEGQTIRAHAVLAAWLGVSMEAAGARVDQYLHATVIVDARYALAARYEGGRLVVRLRPQGSSRASVTPVGAVGVAATNWAALAIEELAPTRGTTLEWVAKERIRDVAERMLHEALDREQSVCLDVAHDGVAFTCDRGDRGASTTSVTDRAALWVAPRGTAFLGPFEAGASQEITAQGDAAHVVARPLCLEDLALVLARDRRGEDVPVSEWAPLAALPHGPVSRACPWVLAARVDEPVGRAVTVAVRAGAKASPATTEARRWIGLRLTDVTLVPGDAPTELWLESADEVVRVDEGAVTAWVAEVGAGEAIHLRVRGPHRGAVVGEAPVSVGPRAAIDVRGNGAALAHATIETHAAPAPRGLP